MPSRSCLREVGGPDQINACEAAPGHHLRLRIRLMQQCYSRSDAAMDDALIEVPTMGRFARIDLDSEQILDETTILSGSSRTEARSMHTQISCHSYDSGA